MTVSEETYRRVALEDPEGRWELECGRLRQKPAMTTEHGYAERTLIVLLGRQLDLREYTIGGSARLRVSPHLYPRIYYVPDVCVVPMAMLRRLRERAGTFEVYDDPVPFVAEVWSPSTGDYDIEAKLREYQRRSDAEIWRIHPYERTVTVWRRQPDGTYTETLYRTGTIRPVALPNVTIEVEALFD